jgi:hypothetical protein
MRTSVRRGECRPHFRPPSIHPLSRHYSGGRITVTRPHYALGSSLPPNNASRGRLTMPLKRTPFRSMSLSSECHHGITPCFPAFVGTARVSSWFRRSRNEVYFARASSLPRRQPPEPTFPEQCVYVSMVRMKHVGEIRFPTSPKTALRTNY